ncbi:MAG: hypothetical protein HZA91_03680 [Verrucomicrobia bacterium]|nr:hypothetical protein [Verrucomicrobiota bacterium]
MNATTEGSPKAEGRNPKEGRRPKSEEQPPHMVSRGIATRFRPSDFGFPSAFGLRPSDFGARRTTHLLAILTLAVVATAALAAGPRAEVSLNGAWQTAPADPELAQPKPTGPWKECAVPGTLNGVNRTAFWFRRSFDVPADWRDRRVLLRFNGVKYNSSVFVNGQRVGGCFNGYDPFALDVTGAVKFGAANELLVGARDWSGIFDKQLPDPPARTDWHALRNWPKDNVLSPVGGLLTLFGIWDDVTLLAVPPVHIADLTIVTSVRKGELVATFEIANEGKQDARVTLKNAIADVPTLVFEDKVFTLAAGHVTNISAKIEWKDAKLWDCEHPNLYHLESRLGVTEPPPPAPKSSSATQQPAPSPKPLQPPDELRTRFGFREFWVERGRFMLNGVPITLRASATWPVRQSKREEIAELWRKTKEANTIAFRTHTQPWRQVFYDVADEAGLMMIPEGAIWNDRASYRVEDERFWKNYRDHLAAMWRRLKNNPSVVMWSLENEFYGGRCTAGTRGEAEMAKAGVFLKKLDPTRPITYESDGDPRLRANDHSGVADVIGMHYPHEYPAFRLYPDTAWWLQHGINQRFFWPAERFKWTRSKPLYIGEFLWEPSSNPDWHTLWFGDDAYLNYGDYRNRGKAASWRDQILAYRAQGLSGIGPWTMFEGGPLGASNHLWRAHQYAYHPIGAYLREADTRFYAGDKVARTAQLFNSTLRDGEVAFEWSLNLGTNRVAAKQHEVALKADDRITKPMLFTAPDVRARTNATLLLKTSMEDTPAFEDRRAISIWPKPTITVGAGVAIFGAVAKKSLPKPLDAFRVIPDLRGLEAADVNVLLVMPGALDVLAASNTTVIIGERNTRLGALQRWVRAGGRALVFPQGVEGGKLLPAAFSEQTSTMTFPQNPQHRALRGIEPDDLKFWRGDGKIADVLTEESPASHSSTASSGKSAAKPKTLKRARGGDLYESAYGHHIVTAGEPVWDARAGALPIVVAGNADGLATAPLMEARRGKGMMLLCGLQLVEKCDTEPAARRILQNCLDYLTDYKGDTAEVVCAGDKDGPLRTLLQRIGVRLAAQDEPAANSRIVVFDGEAVTRSSLNQLRVLAASGATLWLHRPSAAALEHAAKALELKASLAPAHGPIRRSDELPPVAAGLAREDVYWLSERKHWTQEPIRQARDSISVAIKPGGSFTLLTQPGALAVAKVSRGMVIVDMFEEGGEPARINAAKFGRLFATLLANAGADFGEPGDAAVLDANRFEAAGKIPHFEHQPDALYMGSNGKVTSSVRIAQPGEYRVTFIGKGTPAKGQFPIVELAVDGRKLGQVEIKSGEFAAHSLTVELPAGLRELSLSFINDIAGPDGDRNLWLRALEFRRR